MGQIAWAGGLSCGKALGLPCHDSGSSDCCFHWPQRAVLLRPVASTNRHHGIMTGWGFLFVGALNPFTGR